MGESLKYDVIVIGASSAGLYAAEILAGVDYAVFGIKGNGYSKGSTIYSPYTRQWLEAVDTSNGEKVFFLLNRSAFTINPLDESYYDSGAGASGFIGKFNIDLSDLAIMA